MTLRTKLDPKGSQRGRKNTKFFTNIFQKGNELLESPTLKGSPSSEKKTQMPPKKSGSPDDFYTPDEAIAPLLPYLKKEWNIWECASGTGNIVNYLMGGGFNVFGTDIKTGEDFITSSRDDFDCIVTNPPYSLKDKWLEKCFYLKRPFALLLPLTALEGKKRQELYRKFGIQVILFNKRIQFIKGKGNWFSSVWITHGLNLPKELTFVELK
jgi:hypothetical protein